MRIYCSTFSGRALLLAAGLMLTAGAAAAQNVSRPDCIIDVTLTAAGQTAGGPGTCGNNINGVYEWRFNYKSTGFSALSVVVQSAPDVSGAPGTWVPFAGTVTGSNPNTAITQASSNFVGFYPWVRVLLSSVTGTGTITGQLYGCREPGCSITGATITAIVAIPNPLPVDGPTAAGSAPTTPPVLVAGQDGAPGVIRVLKTDANGSPIPANGSSADSDAINNTELTPTGAAGGVLYPRVFQRVFNGATWDRMRGNTLGTFVQGPVASTGANAGNPVKIGAPFNTTQPTFTNGQVGDAQLSARGAQIVVPGVEGFPVTVTANQPANSTATWDSTTPLNTTLAVSTVGYANVAFGLVSVAPITGGVVSFEGTMDGTNWVLVSVVGIGNSNNGSTTITLATQSNNIWQMFVGGLTSFRLRLSTVITGAGTATFSMVPTVIGTEFQQIVAQANGLNLHTNVDALPGATTAQGDAQTNSPVQPTATVSFTAIKEPVYPFVFNGATWDRIRGTTNGVFSQGPVASGATNAGNPLKIGGPFNTTQPTVTDGQMVDGQFTARGTLKVTPGVEGFPVTVTSNSPTPTGAATAQADGATNTPTVPTVGAGPSAETVPNYPYKFNGATWDRDFVCTLSAPITYSAASGTLQIVALSGSTIIRVCHISLSSSAASNFTLEYGTGSSCGTGTNPLTGAYNNVTTLALDFAGTLRTPASQALCIVSSASITAGGVVTYAQF